MPWGKMIPLIYKYLFNILYLYKGIPYYNSLLQSLWVWIFH